MKPARIITAAIAALIAVSCNSGSPSVSDATVKCPDANVTGGNCVFVLPGGGDVDASFKFEFGAEPGKNGIPQDRVFAAIFDTSPVYKFGRIEYPDDAIWVWDSGMRSTASPAGGVVAFSDGTGTIRISEANGIQVKCPSPAPDSDRNGPDCLYSCSFDGSGDAQKARLNCRSYANLLATGAKYYFAVWAWDTGRNLVNFSSKPVEFSVSR